MTKECRSTNGESLARDFLTVSHFVLRHLLLIRHSIICRSSFVLLLLTPALQAADNLGVLGSKPKWGVLEHYQETITKDEFSELIQNVYCTHGIAPDLIEITTDTARILTNRDPQRFFTLRFAKNNTSRNPVPRLWRPANSLSHAKADKPLSGLRIALDPGHLGGKWARMEERWFQVGNTQPVQEGDLILKVERLLSPRLRELGAKVLFVRDGNEPITARRPDEFRAWPGIF